jgi:hypothetical protein
MLSTSQQLSALANNGQAYFRQTEGISWKGIDILYVRLGILLRDRGNFMERNQYLACKVGKCKYVIGLILCGPSHTRFSIHVRSADLGNISVAVSLLVAMLYFDFPSFCSPNSKNERMGCAHLAERSCNRRCRLRRNVGVSTRLIGEVAWSDAMRHTNWPSR